MNDSSPPQDPGALSPSRPPPDSANGQPGGEEPLFEIPEEDEFAAIEAPKRRPTWIGALVVALALYLIYHQRADIVFALTSGQPRNLGKAPAAIEKGLQTLPINRYVRLEGTPDFESGLAVDTQGEWKFGTLYRLLGTDSKIWVKRSVDPLPAAMAERTSFAGRLIPMNDLSFSAAIRAHYEKAIVGTHFFGWDELVKALQDARVPLRVRDRADQDVALQGNQTVELSVVRPGRFEVWVPETPWWTELADAQAQIQKAVGDVPGVVFDKGKKHFTTHSGFTFNLTISDTAQRQALSALADIAAEVRIHRVFEPVALPVSSLSVQAQEGRATGIRGTPQGGQARVLYAAQVVGIRVSAPLRIPEDALLLIEGEKPAQHYRSVVAGAFLLAFALINLLALFKGA